MRALLRLLADVLLLAALWLGIFSAMGLIYAART